MAEGNGTTENIGTHEPSSSSSLPKAENSLNVAKDRNGEDNSKTEEKPNTVPFHRLFSFADSTDILLMVVGTVGAVGNGVGMPLMTIFFGQLIDSFGQNVQTNIVHVISKVYHIKPITFR